MPALLLTTTIVVLSFLVDDLGFHATRYLPGWYLKYFTFPHIGYLLTCTSKGDMNMEICFLLSLKYSVSSTSSITTILPSAGDKILFSSRTIFLSGFLKKLSIISNMKTETRDVII